MLGRPKQLNSPAHRLHGMESAHEHEATNRLSFCFCSRFLCRGLVRPLDDPLSIPGRIYARCGHDGSTLSLQCKRDKVHNWSFSYVAQICFCYRRMQLSPAFCDVRVPQTLLGCAMTRGLYEKRSQTVPYLTAAYHSSPSPLLPFRIHTSFSNPRPGAYITVFIGTPLLRSSPNTSASSHPFNSHRLGAVTG